MYLCNIVNGKRVKMPDTLQVCAPPFFLFRCATLDVSQLIDAINLYHLNSVLFSLGFHRVILSFYFPSKDGATVGVGYNTCETSWMDKEYRHSWGGLITVKQVQWTPTPKKKNCLCQANDRMRGLFSTDIPFVTWFLVWSELPNMTNSSGYIRFYFHNRVKVGTKKNWFLRVTWPSYLTKKGWIRWSVWPKVQIRMEIHI